MSETWLDLKQVTDRVATIAPVIGGGLLGRQLDPWSGRVKWAERALQHVVSLCDHDENRLEAAIEAFAITSLDFLRLQARFRKTGVYARGSAAELDDLYSDPDQMVEYLDGLALSYAMWTNHAAMVQFFAEQFVANLAPESRVLEIGPGHGLLAAILMEHRSDASYMGVDISASSLAYTRRSLESTTGSSGVFELHEADAVSSEFEAAVGDEGFDAIVCCEVLEHVDDPAIILRAVANNLRPGGTAFLSTVANLEAIDHIYLYDNVEHIRSHLAEAGFSLVHEHALVLPGAENDALLPVNYSAVVEHM